MTVADAGKDKCVGNVCAVMKNVELKAGPESGYTTRDLERELKIDFGRTKSGAPNPHVGTPEKAVATIEKATGLKVVNKTPVPFGVAHAEGQYAVFFNKSHVVYARIRNGSLTILDPTIGRGWSSYDKFLEYAKNHPALYGSAPGRNEAYLFK